MRIHDSSSLSYTLGKTFQEKKYLKTQGFILNQLLDAEYSPRDMDDLKKSRSV